MIRSKSFWTGIIGAGVAGAKAFGVEIPEEVVIGLGSLSVIFLRMGIKKETE